MTWDRTKGKPEPIRALNRVVEIECGEPLVPIAAGAPGVRIARESVIPYLREEVVSRLHRASQSLPRGVVLGVVDAWRPFARQARIWEWMWNAAMEAHPGLSYAARRRLVCRFVAPIDQKAPPGHTTGGAVDVWLFDASGEPIDVTSPFERLAGAPTYVFGLSETAQANRETLVEAMLGAGFTNCRDEWWHYSFGDAGWAVRAGSDTCRYGRIELDPALYAFQEEEWLRKLHERVNPFLQEGAPLLARSQARQKAALAPEAQNCPEKP